MFVLVVSVALAMLVLDLIYPFVDRRIVYVPSIALHRQQPNRGRPRPGAGVASGSPMAGRNPTLIAGLVLITVIVLFGLLAPFIIDQDATRTTAFAKDLSPSLDHPLGTDSFGRDMLALIIVGTPQTVKIGLIAGFMALIIGSTLGFVQGYYRGPIGTSVRGRHRYHAHYPRPAHPHHRRQPGAAGDRRIDGHHHCPAGLARHHPRHPGPRCSACVNAPSCPSPASTACPGRRSSSRS